MEHRYHSLPSLDALELFESLARNLSINAAAGELGLSASEIRQKMKVIEDELGVCLIIAHDADVLLTVPGREMYQAISSVLSNTSDCLDKIKRASRKRLSRRIT